MGNEIADIFATFHDGGITGWNGDLKKLTLTIQCDYLAAQFQEGFENFYVTLENIELIEFDPWMNPINLKKTIKKELSDIFAAELEIGYAKTENEIVSVSCNQHYTEFDYCGGTLLIKAKSINIMNHEYEKITPEELYKASENYWNRNN